jgi:hypothetical protein
MATMTAGIATTSTASTASTVGTAGVVGAGDVADDAAAPAQNGISNPLKQALAPLAIDIAVPLAGYYALHSVFGLGTAAALGLSSVVPALRTIFAAVAQREANALAALMLTVNVVAIALTFVSGDARLMLAKDSGVSSVIALGILWSVRRGRPMMSAGLKPFVTKGDAARTAAWDVLKAGSAEFRAKENQFSLIWGAWLLAECVARLAGAFLLAPGTMAWLGTVLLIVALAGACVTGGAAVEPLEKLIEAHVTAASDEDR